MKSIGINRPHLKVKPMFTEEQIQAALDLKFDEPDEDSGAESLKDYLHTLLWTLWDEGEGFSGKRPFGNSGWEYDIYAQFVKAGLINGEIDEDGFLRDVDSRAGAELVFKVIDRIFGVKYA